MTVATQVVESIVSHNGKITVSNPESGNHRTFRVNTQKDDARFAPGERIVGLLNGPNNESDYQSFGFVKPDGRINVWRKFQGTMFERYARMLMNLEHETEKFGLVVQWSATCRRCNRELTTPESIASGIGPICRDK